MTRHVLACVAITVLVAVCACSTGGKQPDVAGELPVLGGDEISQLLHRHYAEWRGTPHRWGGVSRRGVDCSGFVSLTYQRLFGVRLPRTTRDQARTGDQVSRRALRPGDLVFFKTGWRTRHVGIYVGQGRFIHAAEASGVTATRLDAPYWGERFWQARRPL
jgi:cell wall-associated NlpC family hydrolase